MNIIEAIQDDQLFHPFFGELDSWGQWLRALRVVYGLPLKMKTNKRLIKQCTGRNIDQLPNAGFDTALFLTGRRSGKSRIAAVIGAYEAAIAGHESKLSKGEHGIVAVCAPSRSQSRIVKNYLRSIFDTPMLRDVIEQETREGFQLKTGTRIEILTGDWRTVRGFTLLAAIVDEACFFGYDAESKVKSDTELIRAIRPSLATVQGKLVAISSPYAMKGWCYQQFKKHFGNNDSKVLVWNCPSRRMNPTLPKSIIEDAMQEDLQAAKSEYLAEFRDDVGLFLPRILIEQLVVKGRTQVSHDKRYRYFAFADLSGGRSDDAALAIAHKENQNIIVDYLRRWKPPFNPHEVIGIMCNEIKKYDLHRVTGDNYAAEFVASAFENQYVRYRKSDLNKSALYLELLPRLCSGEIELLDNEILINQLSNLERRTRSGGKDIIDHPHGGHDDLANVLAGVSFIAGKKRRVVGALSRSSFLRRE